MQSIIRKDFNRVYDACILDGGFTESREYYLIDKERYWRSLQFFNRLDIPSRPRILEIGGGQMAILCKSLLNADCTVGDVSAEFFAPIERRGIPCMECNLMDATLNNAHEQFDAVFLLEVIEHLPVPASTIFEKLKSYLKPNGILFLTTPNLFRLRNMFRMILGVEFLDRFMLPEPKKGLGHQLEYSADHMRWQIERAGLHVVMLEHDELGRVGHSTGARIARKVLAPLRIRPMWRDGLVVAMQKEPLGPTMHGDADMRKLYEDSAYTA